ncbi:hypothetical protein CCHR01_11577 [Colletotrichum chrysophilum]|uniref:Uncharacterized protein n=1 Tax=Colletotrichum chrysophilum TaxID=1836956 RepID=A0AAD9EI84_9PEZI|nr:hypothetical protein CCHR01_11577 [Colletotrichum chrysophilum]
MGRPTGPSSRSRSRSLGEQKVVVEGGTGEKKKKGIASGV